MNNNRIIEVQINWNEWYFEDAVFRDQVSLRSPILTTGVRFEIYDGVDDGKSLAEIADNIRIKKGFLPLWDFKETGTKCDEDSWYEFYININDWDESHMGESITVECHHASDYVDYDEDNIPLSEEEQIAIYNSIDRQCRDVLGKSCEELLEDARKEVESWNL